jgi:hypothetical protein
LRYELLLLSFQVAVSSAEQPNPKVTLTFIWHAGDRANLLQKIAREYTQQTGVEIKAVLPPMTAQSSLILGCETKLDESFSDKKNAKRAQLSPISSTLPKAQMGLARMERAKPLTFCFAL